MLLLVILAVLAGGGTLLLDQVIARRLSRRVKARLSLAGLADISLFEAAGWLRFVLFALTLGSCAAILIVALFSGWLAALGLDPDVEAMNAFLGVIRAVRAFFSQFNTAVIAGLVALAVIVLAFRSTGRIRAHLIEQATAALEAKVNEAALLVRGEPPAEAGGLDPLGLFTVGPEWRAEFLRLRARHFAKVRVELLTGIRKFDKKFAEVPTNVEPLVQDLAERFKAFIDSPSREALTETGILVLYDQEGLAQARLTLQQEYRRIFALTEALKRASAGHRDFASLSDVFFWRPPPEGRSAKLLRALSSRGAFELAQGTGKRLSRIALILLVPSMLAAAGPSTAVALQGAHARATDFILKISGEEAAAALRDYRPRQRPEQTQLSDQEAVSVLAVAYERSLAMSLAGALPKVVAAGRQDWVPDRRVVARRGVILAATARPAGDSIAPLQVSTNGVRDPAAPAAAAAEGAPLPRQLGGGELTLAEANIDVLKGAHARRGPATRAGQAFEAWLRQVLPELPRDARNSLVASATAWRARLDEPVSPALLRRLILLHSLEIGADALNPTGINPVDTLSVRDRATAFQRSRDIFVTELAASGDVDAAVGRLARTAPESLLIETSAAELKIFEADFLGRVQQGVDPLLGPAEGLALERMPPEKPASFDWRPRAPSGGEKLVAEAAMPILQTGTHFWQAASVLNPDRYSPRGGAWSSPRTGPKPSGGRRVRFRKGLLSTGPDRVTAVLDYQDLHWRRTPAGLELTLVRADGRLVRLGGLDPSTVHLALLTAAQGDSWLASFDLTRRPGQRHVWLAPALQDTTLGCKALLVDQLTELQLAEAWRRYLASGAGSTGADHIFERQSIAYSQALATVFWHTLVSAVGQDTSLRPTDPAIEALATAGLAGRHGLALFDPYVKAWFSEGDGSAADMAALRQAAHQAFDRCAAASADTSAFRSCVTSRMLEHLPDRSARRLTAAVAPPPLAASTSVVIEAPWTVDRDLRFALERPAMRISVARTLFWPSDEPPRRYEPSPTLTPFALGAPDAATRMALADLGDLLRLKRLFLAAFEGHLGKAFPVEKLIDLTRETLPDVRSQGLPRHAPEPSRWTAASRLSCGR